MSVVFYNYQGHFISIAKIPALLLTLTFYKLEMSPFSHHFQNLEPEKTVERYIPQHRIKGALWSFLDFRQWQ